MGRPTHHIGLIFNCNAEYHRHRLLLSRITKHAGATSPTGAETDKELLSARRLFKKPVQQGRSKRKVEAYSFSPTHPELL